MKKIIISKFIIINTIFQVKRISEQLAPTRRVILLLKVAQNVRKVQTVAQIQVLSQLKRNLRNWSIQMMRIRRKLIQVNVFVS